MKKISTLAICLILSSLGFSQSACENFDNCQVITTTEGSADSTRDHAFATDGLHDPYMNGGPGCLSNWEVVSGTPSIWRNSDGISDGLGTAYGSGTQYALMGICGDNYPEQQLSDGVDYLYNFTPGNSYRVSMAIRTSDSSAFIDIDYVLLQNSFNYQYNYNIGCSATPDIPPTGLVVDSIIHFATPHWQVVSFTISNLPASYNRLWIRCLEDQAITANFCLDSFCINLLTPQTTSTCENFDNCQVITTTEGSADSTRDHAFATDGLHDPYMNGGPGCLSNWEVVSGTPSIWRNSDGISDGLGTAYGSGTQYALMGICGDNYPEQQLSDGVDYLYNFAPGNTYTVSMAIRTTDNSAFIDIDYVLLQNSFNYQYDYNIGCSATPDIPPTGLVVDSIIHFATPHWQVVSFTISNLPASYNRLWIRCLEDQAITANFCLDSFCINATTLNGITSLSEGQGFNVYPNPASDQLNVKMNNHPNSYIKYNIMSIDGRVLQTASITQQQFAISTSSLPNGVYLIHLTGDGIADGVRRFEVLHSQ